MQWKKIIKSPFVWAFIVGIVSLHLIKEFALLHRHAPEPMVLVPDWQLVDQNSQVFGKKELAGKLFIANYFFTSCPSVCPTLTAAMKEVYERFKSKADQINFVSISVDPETDTPEVLQNFMMKNGINYPNWHCLTGEKRAVYDAVVEKMRVHMGNKEPIPGGEGVYDIPHLAQLALFDQNGDLRGLFRTDSMELSALVRAANFLLEEGH